MEIGPLEYERRSVQHCIDFLAPLRVTCPPGSAYPDEAIREGERQFAAWMRALYAGMLQNPEAYLVPVGKYAAYLAGAKRKPGIEKFHAADSRESTLRNTFQQGILAYARFFYELGIRLTRIDEYEAFLTTARMDEVYRAMDGMHTARENPARYEKLRELGICIEPADGRVRVACAGRPWFFLGIWALLQDTGKYRMMNYLRLDYRAAVNGGPGIEDVCDVLRGQALSVVCAADAAMAALSCRPRIKPMRSITTGFRWKVEYTLKGRNVLGFYAEPDDVTLCVYFQNAKNITAIAERLQQEDAGLFEWFCRQFPERLCRCPNNRAVQFGAERRRICGLSNRAEVEHANEEDLERALTVLRMFRENK